MAATLGPYRTGMDFHQQSRVKSSVPSALSHPTPLLTKWKGQFSVRLNVTNDAARSWYMDRVSLLWQRLGAQYVTFEGAEGNTFAEQAIQPPRELEGDKYIGIFALMAATLGNSTIISAVTR
ncbi:acyl-CoA dehydrogenase [Platysternon megacephalum]|uniref:Acyl-CoA dehydrogenase n=1 Tax=Platysternon megacephalum TaxID=55544 RepID=A0A4D9DDI4_9SAUR|nr:acyl-CoA dehydrogenase [Platysternon megacephalum]